MATDALAFEIGTRYGDENKHTLIVKKKDGDTVTLENETTGAIIEIKLSDARKKIQDNYWKLLGGKEPGNWTDAS